MSGQPAIDRQLMDRLGDLARLRLGAEREPILRERLARILIAFQALQELPATGDRRGPVMALRLRGDAAEPPLAVEAVLANAPRHAGQAFVVPRVVDA